MAREGTINLITEFAKRQRHNDIIVLTTFCFDPYFFDKFLFHKIRSNNPFSEIIVLVDGQQYAQSMERSTNDTGRNYHLIPIYLPHGVFHPRSSSSAQRKNTATVYIGSANLTMAGFTRNAEMVTKMEYPRKRRFYYRICEGLLRATHSTEIHSRPKDSRHNPAPAW